MDWPPQSPDRNPIESVWDVLEKTLSRGLTLPSSNKMLKMDVNLVPLHENIEVMSWRMCAAIKAKGGPAKILERFWTDGISMCCFAQVG